MTPLKEQDAQDRARVIVLAGDLLALLPELDDDRDFQRDLFLSGVFYGDKLREIEVRFVAVRDGLVRQAVRRAFDKTTGAFDATAEAACLVDRAGLIAEAIEIARHLAEVVGELSAGGRLVAADEALYRLLDRAMQANDAAATRH